ncbi:hypothetical protein Hdeb2414_s0001g00026481 [Helianthus debilis subsp. tardiflorus]
MFWLGENVVFGEVSVERDIVLRKDEDGMVADRMNGDWWDAAGNGVLMLLVVAWRNEEGMVVAGRNEVWLAAGMKTVFLFDCLRVVLFCFTGYVFVGLYSIVWAGAGFLSHFVRPLVDRVGEFLGLHVPGT